jgi:hypothetical protein
MFQNEKQEILGKLWQSKKIFFFCVTCFSFLKNYVCVGQTEKSIAQRKEK